MCINLSIYLFMRKCIIFDIAFGEMHDLLDWKFYKHLSLILGELFDKVIGLLWILKMFYHWFCCLRYVLETFKGLGIIWISDKFCEYLECWRCYQITWKWIMYFYYDNLWAILLFYPYAMTIVIIWWLPSWMSFTYGPNEAPGRITTYLWA